MSPGWNRIGFQKKSLSAMVSTFSGVNLARLGRITAFGYPC